MMLLLLLLLALKGVAVRLLPLEGVGVTLSRQSVRHSPHGAMHWKDNISFVFKNEAFTVKQKVTNV